MLKKHRDNLEKLASYLEANNTAMKFDMALYCGRPAKKDDIKHGGYNPGEIISLYPIENTCGSVGCAIGHGPAAGIRIHGDSDWDGYSERVFGIESWTDEWDWMFSSDWEHTDNTPTGAAARIRWFLEKGLPENAKEQMLGEEPLCYVAV